MRSAWTDLGRGLSGGLSLTHNGEGGPIVRMGVFLADLLGGLGGGGGFVFTGLEAAVEGGHEFVSTGIVDVPKGEQQGASAGVEGAADQTEELVASGDDVEAGGTTAEGEQLGVEPHLVELIEVEITVAEGDAGKHGIVWAEAAVSCDVDHAAVDSLFDQFFVGGGGAQVELGVGEHSMNGVDLVPNQGRFFVGDTKDG